MCKLVTFELASASMLALVRATASNTCNTCNTCNAQQREHAAAHDATAAARPAVIAVAGLFAGAAAVLISQARSPTAWMCMHACMHTYYV